MKYHLEKNRNNKTRLRENGFAGKKSENNSSVIFLLCALTVMLLLVALPCGKAFAASGTLTFSTEKNEYSVGDIISVELLIEADVYPGDFEGYIQYNPDVLEYVSGPSVIAGGEGILRVVDSVEESHLNTRKYVLKFKASGIGYADIGMRQNPSLYEYESGYLMSVSSNRLSMNIIASQKASTDADLSGLKINPGILDPAFDREITEYSTSVASDVSRLVVSAIPSDEAALVSVEGNDNLLEGQNRIVIRVKAEDGNEKKYVIYCVRERHVEAAEDDNDGETVQENENNGASYTSFYAAQDDTGRIFITSDVRYEYADGAEGIEIPKGFTRTSVIVSDIKIPVYAPENDFAGDFLLMVLKNEDGVTGLYRYDRTEKTIQRFVTTDVLYRDEEVQQVQLTDEDREARYNKSVSTLTAVVAVLSGICVLLLIVIVRLVIINKNDKNELPD